MDKMDLKPELFEIQSLSSLSLFISKILEVGGFGGILLDQLELETNLVQLGNRSL